MYKRQVLLNLRKNGLEGAQLAGLKSEYSLHYRVVKFIRYQLPIALISPGLGELQDTPKARGHAWTSGDTGGQPDLLILNNHKKYSCFAIKFKHPLGGGILAENPGTRLDAYAQSGFKTMVSCDYDAIVAELMRYFADIRICCTHCSKNPRKFKTVSRLTRHIAVIHKIDPLAQWADFMNDRDMASQSGDCLEFPRVFAAMGATDSYVGKVSHELCYDGVVVATYHCFETRLRIRIEPSPLIFGKDTST